MAETGEESFVETIVKDTGIPNAVSGIIFANRLYDTIFEVIVFTIAIAGVKHLLANEKPTSVVHQFTDKPSITLARLGATIVALVTIELSIRGHLSPGGIRGGGCRRHCHWFDCYNLLFPVDGKDLFSLAGRNGGKSVCIGFCSPSDSEFDGTRIASWGIWQSSQWWHDTPA